MEALKDWLLLPLVSTVVQDIVDVISVIHLQLHSCYAIDHVKQHGTPVRSRGQDYYRVRSWVRLLPQYSRPCSVIVFVSLREALVQNHSLSIAPRSPLFF